MKKNLMTIIGIVCVLSLLLNGVLLYQNSKYQGIADQVDTLEGTISYYAMHDLHYMSDTAHMYRVYLDNIVNGEAVLEDLFHYSDGIAERVEHMTGLHDIHFGNLDAELKNKLMQLINDCNGALYLLDKHDSLSYLSDTQLNELSTCYGTMERLLNANHKSSVTHYFSEKDYTGTESLKAQSELRNVLDNIETLLAE